MSRRLIYLDYAATTPVDPRVREAMLPFLAPADDPAALFGNASSVHRFGQDVRRALDQARDTVAESIHCHPGEIYFTSGGTEADNTALLGVLLAAREQSGRDHLVTTQIEHHAVLDCARFAERSLGFRVTYLPVDEWGRVAPEAVVDALTDRTALVSVMQANNEIGTIQPLAEIVRRVRERYGKAVAIHTDSVQAYGQLPLDVEALGVDLMTLSAHKIYGPKGAGALYVRKGVRFTPWLHGGMQEREKRAGTENVPAVIGMGKAAELLPQWRDTEAVRLAGLRDDFVGAVQTRLPDAQLNGPPVERLPNNANLSFPGADGETVLLSLDLHGVAASSGSACASGSIDPSHVLLALGLPLPLARAAVRFSLGRGTNREDLDSVVGVLAEVIPSARV